MEDSTTEKDGATMDNNSKALEQIFSHLNAKDDTSHFVGLSLLRSILDSSEFLRSDEQVIKKCWTAVPNKFLTRLLRPGSTDEAASMNDLAVAVIHTFANLLPTADKKMYELVEPMGKVVGRLRAATRMLAVQALGCIVSTPAGAHVFARAGIHREIREGVQLDDLGFWREWIRLYDVAYSMVHEEQHRQFLEGIFVEEFARAKELDVLLDLWATMAPSLHVSTSVKRK